MKTEAYTLISVASWEDRFFLGLERLLGTTSFAQAVILHSDLYAEWTEGSRAQAKRACDQAGVRHVSGVLYDGDPSRTWKETLATLLGELPAESKAVVDISTMPREVIWHVFWFLQYRQCEISYVYHRPGAYDGKWLSRDPDRPRLVYKMSGISRLGARTALVVLAGYDVDRVKHLVEMFEPSVTFLGLQTQSVDPLNQEKMEAQRAAFAGHASVKQFVVDAYSADHGLADITATLADSADAHNVLMASMGPKLSAVSLYQLHQQNDALGLVYLPSREYNREYSKGIGDAIWGSITKG